jgi:hypothetical protein
MRLWIAGLSFLVLAVPTVDSQESGETPPPPQVDVTDPETPVDPDISILEEEDRTVYEYRDNSGRLYMVKVVPKVGKPYYLLDTDGDGELDMRASDPRKVAVNMWELLRW